MRALISCAWAATSMRVEPVGQEAAKARRTVRGIDELPPRLVLPLPEAALVAARQQHQQPIDEEGLILGRDAQPRQTVHMNCVTAAKSSSEAGACAAVMSSLAPFSRASIIRSAATSSSKTWWPGGAGDPLHGVGQVAIEAGEEAEAVLGRQVMAPAGPGSGTP